MPSLLEARSVLEALTSREPVALEKLTNEYCIYALFDHAGQIRYFGATAAKNGGFKMRIYSKHVTGSEGRSHKFSHAYNAGRMWRSRAKLSSQDSRDAKVAKRLRTIFCRRFCKATSYAMPASNVGPNYFSELTALETLVQSIAPLSMRRWEGLQFDAEAEPKELVDALINELGYSSESRRALER
jgi:hypothetical protein